MKKNEKITARNSTATPVKRFRTVSFPFLFHAELFFIRACLNTPVSRVLVAHQSLLHLGLLGEPVHGDSLDSLVANIAVQSIGQPHHTQ